MTIEAGLKHSALTEKIVGAFYDVCNELGYGVLESVDQEALAFASEELGLGVQRQAPITVWFRGHWVGEFRADLLVDAAVLIELKAARTLDKAHEAQLLHSLRATEIEVGRLLNFGEQPHFRRLLLDNERKKIRVNPRKSVAGVGR
jgi:GxxExxY protein